MKRTVRVVLLIQLVSWSLFCLPLFLRPACASHWRIQRHFDRRSASALPFLSLRASRRFQPVGPAGEGLHTDFLGQHKLRFIPGKVSENPAAMPAYHKSVPGFSHAENRRKLLPHENFKKTHTGVVVELESGYGNHNTFIGRLQHGTQFKGAHYDLQGHWEKTNGKDQNKHEEIFSGRANFKIDLSKNSTSTIHGVYFQSQIELPQFSASVTHKKSAIELITALTVNVNPENSIGIRFSGERSEFADHNRLTFAMDRYGGKLNITHHWDTKNTLTFASQGAVELQQREDEHIETKYYGTTTLTNVFTLYNSFALEAGVLFDHYHSQDFHHTTYFIAPIATGRLRLLSRTTLFAAYHPHLVFPDFNKLYIQRLYTTVNPELYAETVRYDLESGIQQRFGDQVSVKLGAFYQERENILVQVDADHDNLLEYIQPGSAKCMGLKVSLQMNFFEQFVQSITYTYTQYETCSLHLPETFSSSGIILPYHPQHQVQASVYWLTPLGFAIDFNGIYQSEQYRSWQHENNRIGSRFFLNVALTQKITDNFQVYLQGRNLTDTDIYDIIPILDSTEMTSSQLFIGGLRVRF